MPSTHACLLRCLFLLQHFLSLAVAGSKNLQIAAYARNLVTADIATPTYLLRRGAETAQVAVPAPTTFSTTISKGQEFAKRDDQAVIILNGATQDGYPNTICALYRGNDVCAGFYDCAYLRPLDPMIQCYDRNTCIYTGTNACCGHDGNCAPTEATACSVSQYSDNSFSSFPGLHTFSVSSGTVLCPAEQYEYSECVTLEIDGTDYNDKSKYTSFSCTVDSPYVTLFAPEVVQTMFAASTISYTTTANGAWRVATFESSLPASQRASTSSQLARVHDNPPHCAALMLEECPKLDSKMKSLGQRYDLRGSFCAAMTELSCPGICDEGTDSTKYLNWMLPACDADSVHVGYSDFRVAWKDYTDVANASYLSLFPWNWRVEYNATADLRTGDSSSIPTCPSLIAKLGAFALINVVVFIASLILGRRDVVYRLTCKCFGKPGTRFWLVTALITIGFNLGANTVNALITKTTPGFQQVPIGGLILLWASRPRMAWAVALLINIQKDKSMYFATGFSAMLAETVLQLVGSVYIGATLNYARKTGYLLVGHLKYAPHGTDALIMYSGALLWMCAAGFLLIKALWLLPPVRKVCTKGLQKVWAWLCWPCSRSESDEKSSDTEMEEMSPSKGNRSAQPDEDLNQTFQAATIQRTEKADSFHFATTDPTDSEELVRYHPTSVSGKPFKLDEVESKCSGQNCLTCREQIKALEAGEKVDRLKLHWRVGLTRMGFSEISLFEVQKMLKYMVLPWIGQWLFWAGFLRLSADLYCPPELWSNTAVWTIFSTLGVFQGASI